MKITLKEQLDQYGKTREVKTVQIQTVEEEMVEELTNKINPRINKHTEITFLHDNEKDLMISFMGEHEPDNEDLRKLKNNEPYNLERLAEKARKYL